MNKKIFKTAGVQERVYDTNNTIERMVVEGKTPYFSGEATVFGQWSEDLGGFREIIEVGAADGADRTRAIAVFNHREDFLLGTRKAGTLRDVITDTGIQVEIDEANTTISRDCAEWVSRNEVDGMSFKFRVAENGSDWTHNKADDIYEHRIHKISEILDYSLVVRAAYQGTSVSLARGIQVEEVPFTPPTIEKTEEEKAADAKFEKWLERALK